jgi:hypothetical protein
MLLDVCDMLAGCGLEPFSVQLFGRDPELNDQIARQILRLDLTAFFLPKPDQRSFVNAHDSPGVRPTNKPAAVLLLASIQFRFQTLLLQRK